MRPSSLLLTALICLAPVAGWSGDEQPVEAELLEFLGTFVTADGKEIDPLLLTQVESPGQKRVNRTARQEQGRVKRPASTPDRVVLEKDAQHEN